MIGQCKNIFISALLQYVSWSFFNLIVEIYKWRPLGCPQTQTWDDPEVRPSKEWQRHHCWWVRFSHCYILTSLILERCTDWQSPSTADQTPTPTRFLKNCEEVGLFNELASPFDHDFKKATEDDIKKVVVMQQITVQIFIFYLSYFQFLLCQKADMLLCASHSSVAAAWFVASCDTHHPQKYRGTHSYGGASRQPSASPRVYNQRWQGKVEECHAGCSCGFVISNLLWNLKTCWYDCWSNKCLDLLVIFHLTLTWLKLCLIL